eukprot:191417-Pelagomonas_calceolata.AAC.1
MHTSARLLAQGAVSDAKAAVEQGKEQLESMEDVDPSVSASVYYVASLLNKATGDSAEFYRSRCVEQLDFQCVKGEKKVRWGTLAEKRTPKGQGWVS